MLQRACPINSPHSPPAFSLARAKARPSPLMGSVLRAGKVPGFIFWLLSSGPMSRPSQRSEKYSTWTPRSPSSVRPLALSTLLRGPRLIQVLISSNAAKVFSSHLTRASPPRVHQPGSWRSETLSLPRGAQQPDDSGTIQPDVLLSPREGKAHTQVLQQREFNMGTGYVQ